MEYNVTALLEGDIDRRFVFSSALDVTVTCSNVAFLAMGDLVIRRRIILW